MTTRITDNGIRVLTPADGMRLTDGETVAEGEVYLGVNASPDTWREVTIAEAESIIEETKRKEEEALMSEENPLDGASSEHQF